MAFLPTFAAKGKSRSRPETRNTPSLWSQPQNNLLLGVDIGGDPQGEGHAAPVPPHLGEDEESAAEIESFALRREEVFRLRATYF